MTARVFVGALLGSALVSTFDSSPGGWISAAVALLGALAVKATVAQ